MSNENNKDSKRDILRHSTAHILAAAVLDMFPEAKLGIGPTIEDGFYYDFDLPRTLIPEDLPILEEKMREIIKQNPTFEKTEVDAKKAEALFKKAGQAYKIELIKELSEQEAGEQVDKKKKKSKNPPYVHLPPVTIYKTGSFVDLCRGPHLDSAGEIKPDAFKLLKIAGAYWRGSEKNKMLQRIYGTAFETKKELDEYLKKLEEAEKRDHRKLGKELDLFCFSDLVGSGLPLYTPKGVIIIDELKKHVEAICRNYGFQKVMAPHIAKIELFETSGHAKKFGEELFSVSSPRGHKFALKPVQCPHHTQIYASKPRSYRELPISYMESDRMYRAEKPGEIGGLNRVYAITVEDGHTFCRIDQVKNEIKKIVNIIKDFYSGLGMWGKHWVSLSVRDYAHPEKYIGEPKDWDNCEKLLQEVSDEMGLGAKRREGEAALYGPKLDFMFKDALGREIQIPTVQVDFATPKRFGLTYSNDKGKEEAPVMVHRAILGSYERFLVLLIEHFAGAFPVWLAPEQVWVLPIGSRHEEYARKVADELKTQNIRVVVKNENETIGKKIREGEMQKIPYLLIVGDKEISSDSAAVRERGKGDLGPIKLDRFLTKIGEEIKNKTL